MGARTAALDIHEDDRVYMRPETASYAAWYDVLAVTEHGIVVGRRKCGLVAGAEVFCVDEADYGRIRTIQRHEIRKI